MMGHEVETEDGTRARHHGNRYVGAFWRCLQSASPSIERAMFRRLVRKARLFRPDLVLVTCGVLPPMVVKELKDVCPGKVVCWYTDSIAGLYRQYLLAADYDALFLKEPWLVETLRTKVGLNAYYLPECCNPLWHKRLVASESDRAEYGCEIAAIGSFHYYRARMLEGFLGYDLRIWGKNCPRWVDSPAKPRYMHKYVAAEEKAKVFASARIVVNAMLYSEIDGVNCTLFEVAGSGAFQIADWKPSLASLFVPEREIVTFRTCQELKEKVDYFLASPDERQKIADRAYARAHRDHTYENRLSVLLSTLGFRATFSAKPVCTLA